MFTYRLHSPEGTISARRPTRTGSRSGTSSSSGGGRRFRVLDVMMFEEEDESPFVRLVQVEAA
jgi:hypothetical protein